MDVLSLSGNVRISRHGERNSKEEGSNFSAETIFIPFLQRLLMEILRTELLQNEIIKK